MKTKLNLLAFLLPLFEMEISGGGAGDASGAISPPPASFDEAASSAANLAETSTGEQPIAGSETAVDGQQPTEQSVDPLEGLPSLEELEQQAAANVPYAKGLASLRAAYESTKPQLEEYKALQPWKDVADKIGDPVQAQSAYELQGLLHSAVPNSTDPNDFTTVPFLQKIEADSPGTVDQLYADCGTFPIEVDGVVDTVARHRFRQWGLNPDNIENYKALDSGTLSVASGIVKPDELVGIDARYHDAYRSLSVAKRADIQTLKTTEGGEAIIEEDLRNASRALEVDKYMKQQEVDKAQAVASRQQTLESEIQAESQASLYQATSEIYTSIHKNLAQQVKFSSDELSNELHLAGIMSNLYTLLDPEGRKLILDPVLQKAGVVLDSTFDATVNRFAERLSAAKRFEKMGDTMRQRAALSESTQARQMLTAKLNSIAMKFAQPTSAAVTANAQANGNLTAGTPARMIPNGNVAAQNGNGNPFLNNPHAFNTPEYGKWNEDLERKMRAASV